MIAMSQTSAIYNKADNSLRVINIAGKWQMQRHDGSRGTREHDPWFNVGRPMDDVPSWSKV